MRELSFRAIGLFCMMGLIGCTPPKQQDGPPLVYSKSQITPKKVEPKYEPKSRYGNPASYEVMGNTYKVLSTAENFKQVGLASWYGVKFHQKRTSSGEPYNMFAMTAAHKTLPLPTYLKVKNLDNAREVVVKVNDRGPFHDGRIIDLSYTAAKALGILAKGTGRVEITALTPAHKHNKAGLYLQLGAFSEEQKAINYKEKLSALVQVAKLMVEKKKQIFAVVAGPFKTQLQRKKLHHQLVENGYQGIFSYLK